MKFVDEIQMTVKAGDGGNGWNVFYEDNLGEFSISPGSHTLSVQVSGGDGYGVELDKFTFNTVAQ